MSKTVIIILLVLSPHTNIFAEPIEDSITEELDDGKNYEIDCPGGFLLSAAICLPFGYRKGEPPRTPTEINTAMAINNIREIDDTKMTVSLEFQSQLVWTDKRIVTNLSDEEKMTGKVLNSAYLQKVWKPDLFIENLSSFKLHSILDDISGFSIGNGLRLGWKNETIIFYEFSAKATVYCNFEFFRYPMDEQNCNFTVGTTYPSRQAVVFTFHSSVFQFAKWTRNTDDFDVDIININDNMDNHTRFGFTIKLNRRVHPYILECYLPCVTIIIVTHISFVIPIDAVPGRIALLVTQFLTLTNICIYQQVIKILP